VKLRTEVLISDTNETSTYGEDACAWEQGAAGRKSECKEEEANDDAEALNICCCNLIAVQQSLPVKTKTFSVNSICGGDEKYMFIGRKSEWKRSSQRRREL
jgi:hypothetical protein